MGVSLSHQTLLWLGPMMQVAEGAEGGPGVRPGSSVPAGACGTKDGHLDTRGPALVDSAFGAGVRGGGSTAHLFYSKRLGLQRATRFPRSCGLQVPGLQEGRPCCLTL